MRIIVENFSLAELKDFLTESNLYGLYACPEQPDRFFTYTTADGMDHQNSYQKYEVCAKFWIQYFPKGNQFALNVNFFANVDGAPIGPQDFIRLVPEVTKPYEYYNSEKIRWVQQGDTYIKVAPNNTPYHNYSFIPTIIPIG